MRRFGFSDTPRREKKTAHDAVNGVLHRLGFDPARYSVFEIWDRECRAVIRGCEAIAFQGTRLVVRAPSAVHRQELMYLKDRLLKRVNQAMGRTVLTDIRFELSAGTEKEGQDAPSPEPQNGGTLRGDRRQWSFRPRHDSSK